MSTSKRRTQRQQELWIHTADIAVPAGHPFYQRLNDLPERPVAHCYETGGMRRTPLKGHVHILKRLLIHVAGCNPALFQRATRWCRVFWTNGSLLSL